MPVLILTFYHNVSHLHIIQAVLSCVNTINKNPMLNIRLSALITLVKHTMFVVQCASMQIHKNSYLKQTYHPNL